MIALALAALLETSIPSLAALNAMPAGAADAEIGEDLARCAGKTVVLAEIFAEEAHPQAATLENISLVETDLLLRFAGRAEDGRRDTRRAAMQEAAMTASDSIAGAGSRADARGAYRLLTEEVGACNRRFAPLAAEHIARLQVRAELSAE